jgi:hypothetical protein
MDVFSTELGIWLGFVKTSEFWGGLKPPLRTPLLTTDRTHTETIPIYVLLKLPSHVHELNIYVQHTKW